MMNSTTIIRIVFLFILCLSVETQTVFALDKNLVYPVYNWGSTEYIQGTNGSVSITLVNNSLEELTVSWAGLRFPWMIQDFYYQKDFHAIGDLPIPIKGSGNLGTFYFQVPSSAQTGVNNVELRINYQEHSLSGWSYSKDYTFSTTIVVVDVLRGSYTIKLNEVGLKLESCKDANYSSPVALSLIQQTDNEIATAQTFASNLQYTEAIAHLTLASNALSQADATETEYKKTQEALHYQETVLREEIRLQKETITKRDESIRQQGEKISQQEELINQQEELINQQKGILSQQEASIKQQQQTILIIGSLLGIAIIGLIGTYFVLSNKLKKTLNS